MLTKENKRAPTDPGLERICARRGSLRFSGQPAVLGTTSTPAPR
jgi:hypothetical protein